MNARYHSIREGYLDEVHRWLIFVVIIASALPLLDVLVAALAWAGTKADTIKAVLGAAALIAGTLDLTFDLSNRARMHSMAKRRYFELLADLVEGKKQIVEVEACLHRFSADEESPYHALLTDCWNAAQEMVYGDKAQHIKLSWFKRTFKNFFSFSGTATSN